LQAFGDCAAQTILHLLASLPIQNTTATRDRQDFVADALFGTFTDEQ